MKRVSQKIRTASRKRALEFRDCNGLSLPDVRDKLGEDKFRWPRLDRTLRDVRVCDAFHRLHPYCWIEPGFPSEAHHEASGSRGRVDHMCLLFAFSAHWHAIVHTKELPLGRMLYLKWEHDWPHCDWEKLTLYTGYFLPDIQP